MLTGVNAVLDNDTKVIWCTQQTSSCESLCQDEFQGVPDVNECYDDDLQYQCICPGGLSPNASEYVFQLHVQLYICITC